MSVSNIWAPSTVPGTVCVQPTSDDQIVVTSTAVLCLTTCLGIVKVCLVPSETRTIRNPGVRVVSHCVGAGD